MKKINTLLERIRDPFGLVKKKWFRVLSAVVLDSMLVMVLLFFLLYRCTNWTDGRVYWLPPDTIDLLIDGTLWACIALEFLHSPLRGIAALGVMLIRNSGRVTYPQTLYCEAVLVPLLANLGSMRNNRAAWLMIHAVGFEFLFFLRLTGQVSPSLVYETKRLFSNPATSFALGHPNSLAIVCMGVLLFIWAYRRHKNWISFLWFILGAMIVFVLTWSRTVFITMLLFPFVALLVGYGKHIKTWKAIFWALVPMIAMLISLGASLVCIYYPDNVSWLGDIAFRARFTDFRQFIDHGITLFGAKTVVYDGWYWFDNMFWWLLHYCGSIPLFIALVGYGYMNSRLYQQKQFSLLAVSVIFLIYCIMENAIIYPFHFFVPLLAFARDEEAKPVLSPESGPIITGKEVVV